MNRWFFFGLFLIVFAPVFPGGRVETGKTTTQQPFTLAHPASSESLDPHFFSTPAAGRLWDCLFEGLVVPDPQTGEGVPGLAERWDISPDGRTYTFHLRKSFWEDGTPVTAGQAAASWKRVLNPVTGSPYAWYPALFIRGAEAYREGRSLWDKVGISAPGPYTLVVELAAPCPFFINALIHKSFAILPMHQVELEGSAWDRLEAVSGNGPFRIEKPLKEDEIRLLLKDPSEAEGQPDSLIFRRVESPAAALELYRKGHLDWIPADMLDPSSLSELKEREDFLVSPDPSSYFYVFNTERPPLDDPRIRRVLSLSVDREKLRETILRGSQIPAWSLVPSLPGYTSLSAEYPDFLSGLEEARDLLALGGYPEGRNFPVSDLIFLEGEGHRAVAEFLRDQWRKHLNIEVRLMGLSAGSYYREREKGAFDLSLGGWQAAYQDPSAFLNLFLTGESLFGGSYSSPDFDALMIESSTQLDREVRRRTLGKAEELLCRKDTALLPLFSYSTPQLINRELWSGFYPNPRDIHPLEALRIR